MRNEQTQRLKESSPSTRIKTYPKRQTHSIWKENHEAAEIEVTAKRRKLIYMLPLRANPERKRYLKTKQVAKQEWKQHK